MVNISIFYDFSVIKIVFSILLHTKSLQDDNESIRTEIEILWKKCGEQYYNENETELSQIEMVDHQPDNYPPNVNRPSLGCRSIVKRSLRIVPSVALEIREWREEIRIHSLKLLYQIVLHSEAAIGVKIIDIFPSLCQSSTYSDCYAESVSVANLLGLLLEYSAWNSYVFEQLKLSAKLGQLICFTEMFRYADNGKKSNDLNRISLILLDPTICHNMNEKYQHVLLELVAQLVDLYLTDIISLETKQLMISDENDKNGSTTTADTKANIYTIIIKIIALTETSDKNKNVAEQLLEKLVGGKENVSTAHGMYLKTVLTSIDGLDVKESERSEPILLLHGIIKFCGFQIEYLAEMVSAIQMVINDGSPNGKIKIFSAICLVRFKVFHIKLFECKFWKSNHIIGINKLDKNHFTISRSKFNYFTKIHW